MYSHFIYIISVFTIVVQSSWAHRFMDEKNCI